MIIGGPGSRPAPKLMGYQGKSFLDAGFIYAPFRPLEEDTVSYKEIMELVFLHIRESLPVEVLPASYKMEKSWAAGKERPCIHLTMDECRTFMIFPLTDNSITFFYVEKSAWSTVGDKRAFQDILVAENPSFLDDLDKIVFKWYRSERKLGTRKERSGPKKGLSKKWTVYCDPKGV